MAYGTPQQVALRCRIVLAAAIGRNNVAIGSSLQLDHQMPRVVHAEPLIGNGRADVVTVSAVSGQVGRICEPRNGFPQSAASVFVFTANRPPVRLAIPN